MRKMAILLILIISFPLVAKESSQNLLAISWQNAFCQNHKKKRECRNMTSNDFGASNFVLHGLWPQPRNNLYCNVSKKEIGMDKNGQWRKLNRLHLSSTVRRKLAVVMPGYESYLHRHEWIKHGTCYGTNEDTYYKDAIKLLMEINNSEIKDFFNKNIGKRVSLKEIRRIFDKEFGRGAGKHVTMNCRKGLIVELWIHIGNRGNNLSKLLKGGSTPKSKCYSGIIDPVGF